MGGWDDGAALQRTAQLRLLSSLPEDTTATAAIKLLLDDLSLRRGPKRDLHFVVAFNCR
jgi:hypothetical protein